jgi:hypothetical protein
MFKGNRWGRRRSIHFHIHVFKHPVNFVVTHFIFADNHSRGESDEGEETDRSNMQKKTQKNNEYKRKIA